MCSVWFFKAIFYEVSVLSWKEDVIPLRGGDKEEKKKELLLEVSDRNHYVSAVAKEVVSLNSSVNTIRGLIICASGNLHREDCSVSSLKKKLPWASSH